jgi:hypothetical protein
MATPSSRRPTAYSMTPTNLDPTQARANQPKDEIDFPCSRYERVDRLKPIPRTDLNKLDSGRSRSGHADLNRALWKNRWLEIGCAHSTVDN